MPYTAKVGPSERPGWRGIKRASVPLAGKIGYTDPWMTRPWLVLPLVLLAWTRPASAESPYTLKLDIDLPVIGLGGAASLMALLEVPPPACLPRCSAGDINPLDRSVLGNYSESAHTAADVAVAGLLTLPLLLNALDSRGSGWLVDSVVYGEALLLAQALTQITKFAVRRTAPFAYDPGTPDDAWVCSRSSRAIISSRTSWQVHS